VKVPIACSLAPDAARSQIDEWHELFDRSPEPLRRIAADRLEVTLPTEPSEVWAAMELARRELACCPFFRFSVVIEDDRHVLEIAVPEGSAQVLDGLVLGSTLG
jgi:hypothetical protein